MIYYFTGTGNSKWVAERIARLTNDTVMSIAEIMAGKEIPEPELVTGLVFPVYAWAPPEMVIDFAKNQLAHSQYMYCVCTCGSEAGGTVRALEKTLRRDFSSAYSISMPNNFMLGFDVDSDEEMKKKLMDANVKTAIIADAVNQRKTGIYEVNEGIIPKALTSGAGSIFKHFGASPSSFYSEGCVSCGKCVSVCPNRNIELKGGIPLWGDDCSFCFACINHCPEKAIQLGKGTKDKGRYVNPNTKVEYDFGD